MTLTTSTILLHDDLGRPSIPEDSGAFKAFQSHSRIGAIDGEDELPFILIATVEIGGAGVKALRYDGIIAVRRTHGHPFIFESVDSSVTKRFRSQYLIPVPFDFPAFRVRVRVRVGVRFQFPLTFPPSCFIADSNTAFPMLT